MYIVMKYKNHLYDLLKQVGKLGFGELLLPVSQWAQVNFIFTNNFNTIYMLYRS